jgi:CheY-like chemotaxis protein
VVDDNPDLRTYLRRLLGRHWTVDVAADVAEARARLASASPPDLVVADVMMAEIDGLTLLREVRADPHLQDLPVILLSARAGDDDTVAGLEAGADDYVRKPFSSRELVARVGAQLELSRLRRQRDQAVRTGDDRLALALAASGFVAFEWDTATKGLAFLGGDGGALFGIGADVEEMDFSALVDVVHEDDLADHLAGLDRARTEGEAYAGEYRIRRPGGGGEIRWIRSVAHRLPNDSRRLFGVATDVTDLHAADERLGHATDRLRADVAAMVRFQELTERLAASPSDLGQLLADVLDATIELHQADGGTACLYDTDTGDLDVVVRRRPEPAPAEHDRDYRVLRPGGAGTQSIPLLDRAGQPLGVLTTHTRYPRPRTDLDLRLAELYVRQAQAVVAVTAASASAPAPKGPGSD